MDQKAVLYASGLAARRRAAPHRLDLLDHGAVVLITPLTETWQLDMLAGKGLPSRRT